MKYLIFFFVLISACNKNSPINKEDEVKMVSGFIWENNGQCEFSPGYNTERLTCKISKNDRATYQIEILANGLFKKTPPVCVFDGFSHVKSIKKIQTNTTVVSTNQIWIELPSFAKEKPTGGLVHFICTYY